MTLFEDCSRTEGQEEGKEGGGGGKSSGQGRVINFIASIQGGLRSLRGGKKEEKWKQQAESEE